MLKPADIQNKDFGVKMRGYDRDEVDDFLDTVIADMTTLYRDNTELTSRLKKVEEELASFKAREGEITKSLELARYQCDEIKKNAQIEAKQVIDKAHIEAQSALHNIENSKIRMKSICSELLEKLNNM